MTTPILTAVLQFEHDVVQARRRARQIAALLGFDTRDQTRIATAVSEIARNAFQYAGGGQVEFLLESGSPALFQIRIRDHGPGIRDLNALLEGRYTSTTGMGLGIVGTRRLMERFCIESESGKGTLVEMSKQLPPQSAFFSSKDVARITAELAKSAPEDPFAEIQQQNQELLRALDELRARQEELSRLNRELEDTNRGVVALYAELDDKADFLRRANETKTRFLSNMSHEFRTPLNAILGLSQLLLDGTDGPLTPDQEKQVTFIRRSAHDLSELVNDLLDLAKVEAGKITVRPILFEPADLFKALRGMLRPLLANNTSVTLDFDETVGIPSMRTDEGKVSQILRNFISNALKFTERGSVRVFAENGPNDTVIFSVQDTGMGIAPENQEYIFEEFVQIENARQQQVKGTGLGLPLSKRLAELLGGSVTVQSAVGFGATFSAIIPILYQGPTDSAYASDIFPRLDPNASPVLIVEDNRESRFIYERYLKADGFQAIPALTIQEARQILRQVRPIAVILDILLEGESGWTLLGEIKNDPDTRHLPVFVVTLVDNERKAMSMGADAFHIKPADQQWLLNHLRAAKSTSTQAEPRNAGSQDAPESE